MAFPRFSRVCPVVLIGFAVFAASAASSSAVVLVSDNFDDLANGASLNGRSPTVNLINSTWSGTTTNFQGNGLGGLTANSAVASSISLDLGDGFLLNNPGVYEMSLEIFQPSSGATNANSWIAFGIASGGLGSNNLVANNGAPWVLMRLNGSVNFYGGPNTQNQLTNNTGMASVVASTGGSAHEIRLQLNTTGAQWTLNGWVDNTQVDLNGTAAAGNTFTFASNPTTSRYLQLSTGVNGASDVGRVDNFVLTSTTVPEPGVVVTLAGGLGVLGAFRRFRRMG